MYAGVVNVHTVNNITLSYTFFKTDEEDVAADEEEAPASAQPRALKAAA